MSTDEFNRIFQALGELKAGQDSRCQELSELKRAFRDFRVCILTKIETNTIATIRGNLIGSIFRWTIPIVISMAALWFAMYSQPASAQSACAPHDEAIKMFENDYGKVVVGQGAAGPTIIELLVDPDGQFSILQTTPDGVTCLRAAGSQWRVIPPGEDT